jgi:hypothetical protein
VQIHAFVPASAVVLENDAVNAFGVPQNEIHLPPLQERQVHQATAPILLCVSAESGTEHDPQLWIKVHDANGEQRCNAQNFWIWDDVPGRPLKWRVFDLQIPFLIFGGGVYTFGVYAGEGGQLGDALTSFQFSIILDAPGQLPQGQFPPPGVSL